MAATLVDDVRFTVPLYSSAEAARYLDVRETTFRTWVKGYRREFPDRPPVEGRPLLTDLPAEKHGGPSIPFIGLAEGMFLSALRKADVSLQQIRPALDLVRTKLGVQHALASKRLYAVAPSCCGRSARKVASTRKPGTVFSSTRSPRWRSTVTDCRLWERCTVVRLIWAGATRSTCATPR